MKTEVEKTEKKDTTNEAGQERLAYTMRQTATLLNVNYQTVYRLCKRGMLKSSTALRTKLFAKEEILRFLSRNDSVERG